MFIVNLSYNPEDLKKTLNQYESAFKICLLDFASVFPKDSIYEVYYPSDIDSNNSVHQSAIDDYIQSMSLLSLECRDIKINSLPLYWLTDISEKHPQECVLKNLYYFKHIIKNFKIKHKTIAFVLPESATHFQSAIRQFIEANIYGIEQILFNLSSPIKTIFLEDFKKVYFFFRKALRTGFQIRKENKTTNEPDVLIFTYLKQTWRDSIQGDYVLHGIENFAQECKKTSSYAVFFFDYYEINNLKINKKWSSGYFNNYPTTLKLLRLFIQQILSLQVKSKLIKQVDFVNTEVIDVEIKKVIVNKGEYLVNYIWLKNYFSKVTKPMKVFYQDEFYTSGKVVSAAAKFCNNKNIESFGVQHGIFYEAHTVYSITDKEISNVKDKDGYPLPHKFVVWGNYFKQHFLKRNALPESFVLAAGFPNYILYKGDKANKEERSQLKILWCTTIKVDVINQYNKIISDFVKNLTMVEIVVRCHPHVNLYNFILNELIDNDIKDRFLVSEHKTIQEAINESDVVLSSSGSTIFLDAILCNKPVLKLVNNDYYMGDLGKDEMPEIYNAKDLETEVLNIKNIKSVKDYHNLLTTDKTEWHKILTNYAS